MRSCVKIKFSRKREITLPITEIGSRILNVTSMSFNTIRENKILAKTSGFTVTKIPNSDKFPHDMEQIIKG